MTTSRFRPVAIALTAVLGLAASGSALASPGGFHGAAHVGGWSHGGWGHGGWGHGGWHGGYYGGWHGGYYGGWRGGYYRGWGLFGAGLFLGSLPWYYSTYYWDGVPYYYADSTYYRWNGAVRQYEVVAAPAGRAAAAQPAVSTELFMYPKGSQSTEQQARDKYECHRWAADQSGFDPTQAGGGVAGESTAAKRADYLRADGACLDGRNYSVR